MRRKLSSFLFWFSVVVLLIFSIRTGHAAEPQKIRCTCYTLKEFTATGEIPYQGMCAYRTEDIGKVAYLYEIDEDGNKGDFIGEFEIKDTGGKAVKKGHIVDVWRPDDEAVDEWITNYGDYVYMEIGESNGF